MLMHTLAVQVRQDYSMLSEHLVLRLYRYVLFACRWW